MCVGVEKVSLYSNRTRQGSTVDMVQDRLAGFWGRKGYRSTRMADPDSRIVMISRRVFLVSFRDRERCREVEGNGQWVLIDLCSPV